MSDERSHIYNGRFLQNLNNWVATGASYAASDGDDHYGMALIDDAGTLAQAFSVIAARAFTLHLSVKPGTTLAGSDATITITDGNGATVTTQDLTGDGGVWNENTFTFGLTPATTYTLTITNASGEAVRVDDVWLWWVPITRDQIAARVHAKLARLATERSLNITPSGAMTEGSYTYAVDSGLRSVDAIDSDTGLPDVRYLNASTVNLALESVEREVLEQLRRDYAVEVDISIGQRRESLSQVARALGDITGGGKGGSGGGEARQVMTGKLLRKSDDYDFG